VQNYNSKLKTSTFFAVFFSFAFLFLLFPSLVHAITNPQSSQIIISASIGEPKLTLFGYTSPHALVQLDGQGVAEEVIADENGYFFFDRIFLPYPKPQYPELCLSSIDTQSRLSFPNCLPTLPIGPFDITVGPVLLSPTLSLSKGSFLPQEQVVAEGLTIPNSEVMIFLANDSKSEVKPTSNFNTNIHPLTQFLRGRTVYAYSLPQYQIKADEKGYFEVNLPTIKKTNWKIFAGAIFQNSLTPKSQTLNFKIQSWWEWFWGKIKQVFGLFFNTLKPNLWTVIIIGELIVMGILLVKWRLNKGKLGKG